MFQKIRNISSIEKVDILPIYTLDQNYYRIFPEYSRILRSAMEYSKKRSRIIIEKYKNRSSL